MIPVPLIKFLQLYVEMELEMGAVTPAGRVRLVEQAQRNATRRNQESRNGVARHANVLRRSEEARIAAAAEQAAINAHLAREDERYRRNAAEAERTYPAYLNSRRAWEANEARKKREDEAEQAEENRQPRVRKANVDREAAALPNAQLEDSDVPKLKAELKTLPMILDDFLKKLEVRIKKGRVPEATEDEKSVAKEAKQMQLGKKFSPMAQKPRDSPFSEEEFRAARRNQKQLSGDRYEYEQKLFAEPGFGPIRVNPEYPHEVFMEMEDGTARYFESGYPKNDNANPYPYIPIRRTSAVPAAAPGLSAGGSRKKKRSTRSKKNRSRK